MAERHYYPELLQDLADKLADMLVQQGLDPEAAGNLGFEAAEFLRNEWGGQQIYIPKGVNYELDIGHQTIWRKWVGGSEPVELARENDLSLQAVYRILRLMRQREKEKQPSLFDLLEVQHDGKREASLQHPDGANGGLAGR